MQGVRGYWIWLIVSLFLFFDILLRVFPNILVTTLQDHYHANAYQLGWLSASFIYAYGIMQLPAGILIDRFGLKPTLFAGCLLAALSVLLMGATSLFWMACFARVLMGVGSAFAFLGCMQVIIEWFPPHKRAFLTGCTMMIGSAAGIVCNAFLLYLNQAFGWHSVLGAMILFGLVLAVMLVMFVTHPRDRRTQVATLSWVDLKMVFKRLENWEVGLVCALIYLPYAILNDLWGVPFFRVVDHLTKSQAGYVISGIWMGWLIGSPLIGVWADRINNRVRVMFQLTVLQVIILALLFYVSWSSFWMVQGLGFCVGVTAAAMALCYVYGQLRNPAPVSAVSSAMINSVVTVVVLLALPAVGSVMDHVGGASVVNQNVLHYSIAGYRIALSILMSAPILALILLYRLMSGRYTSCP